MIERRRTVGHQRRWLARWCAAVSLLAVLPSCAQPGPPAGAVPAASHRCARVARRAAACAPAVPTDAMPTTNGSQAAAPSRPQAGGRLRLALGEPSMPLAPGRWVVAVALPARSYVSVGLVGAGERFRAFEVVGTGALRALHSGTLAGDSHLPTFVSAETVEATELLVVADVGAPVQLLRVAVSTTQAAAPDALAPGLGKVEPRPLVGLPFPIEPRAGYALGAPHRYQFLRADVVRALRAALRQVRLRYRRNAIAIGDGSQWNGDRPAVDLGKPRHISHQGGRDVDIALPSRTDGPARIVRHCQGVLIERDRLECAPGTVRQLDAERLAYFLGLLIDGPTPGGRYVPDPKRRPGPVAEVETIFTDQVYVDEIRRALPVLRRKHWIHQEAYGALGEEGLLRPSPWHVDHVHVRFAGEAAAVPEPLRFVVRPSAPAHHPATPRPQ